MDIKSFLIRILYKSSFILACEITIAAVLSLYIGTVWGAFFNTDHTQVGALWCAISAILVIQGTNDEIIEMSWIRIQASFFGALFAGISVSFLGYGLLPFAISLFLSSVICALLGITPALRMTTITVAVIIVVGELQPALNPWLNSGSRFVESFIGVVVGMMIALPLKAIRKKLRENYEHLQ